MQNKYKLAMSLMQTSSFPTILFFPQWLHDIPQIINEYEIIYLIRTQNFQIK